MSSSPRLPSAPLAAVAPWITGSSTAALRWRVLGVVVLLAVTALAVTPQPPTDFTTGWDKANHAIAFCALGLTSRLGFPGGRWRWVALMAGLLAVGGLIEVAQHFVPGREADGADLVADALGAGCGLLAGAALAWFAKPAVNTR